MTLHIHRGRGGNRQNTNKNQDKIDGFVVVIQVSFRRLSFEHIPFTVGAPLGSCEKSSGFDKNMAPRLPKL